MPAVPATNAAMSGNPPVPPTNAAAAPARAEAESGALDAAWLADGELVDAGYAETIAAADIQTSLPPPEPPPAPPPEWLLDFFGAIADFFAWTAPALKIALWIAAGLLLVMLLYRFVPGFAAWVDARRKRPAVADADEPFGIVEASVARARLVDADALARDGYFAEAVHLLLARSVDDIAARRPGLVRPALTARDIAAAHGLPGVARAAFAHIARAVELSLFGGHAVDAAVWDDCRAAYSELTIAKNWAAA